MGRYDFYGYRRENGRVGIRNHVVMLPLDDLSNAACEAVANNIKGTLALPHPYGRLQFGEDLELHFRTLIGTGIESERGGLRGDRHRAGMDRPRGGRHRRDGQARGGIFDRGQRRHQHDRERRRARRANSCSGPVGEAAGVVLDQRVVRLDQVRRERHDVGTGVVPTVGNLIDKLDPLGATTCFGETSELTGAEVVCASRAATKEVSDKFMTGLQRVSGSDRTAQDQRSFRIAADQGKYRRRIDDHRGKSLRQPAEDREEDQSTSTC